MTPRQNTLKMKLQHTSDRLNATHLTTIEKRIAQLEPLREFYSQKLSETCQANDHRYRRYHKILDRIEMKLVKLYWKREGF